MSFLNRLTKNEIRKKFKYKALAFGIVPVYLSDIQDITPNVQTRNWVPELVLSAFICAYFFFFDIVDPYEFHEREIPLKITGRIK